MSNQAASLSHQAALRLSIWHVFSPFLGLFCSVDFEDYSDGL